MNRVFRVVTGCFVLLFFGLLIVAVRPQEEYHALRAREESESQFKDSKEGGYTSQGWTHIPLVNAREPEELYTLQRAQFPKTFKVRWVLRAGQGLGCALATYWNRRNCGIGVRGQTQHIYGVVISALVCAASAVSGYVGRASLYE